MYFFFSLEKSEEENIAIVEEKPVTSVAEERVSEELVTCEVEEEEQVTPVTAKEEPITSVAEEQAVVTPVAMYVNLCVSQLHVCRL